MEKVNLHKKTKNLVSFIQIKSNNFKSIPKIPKFLQLTIIKEATDFFETLKNGKIKQVENGTQILKFEKALNIP